MDEKKYCHGADVTQVYLDTPDSPVGSTVVVDGQCYIKTGNNGSITHALSAIQHTDVSCVNCLSAATPED
jgi:hypothetical protein